MLIHLYRRHPEDHVVFAGFQKNGTFYRIPYQPEVLRAYGNTAQQITANIIFQERCQDVARKLELQPQLEQQAISTKMLILPEGHGSKPEVKVRVTTLNSKRIEWQYMLCDCPETDWKTIRMRWDAEIYVGAVSLSSPDGLSAEGKAYLLAHSRYDNPRVVHTCQSRTEELERFVTSLPIRPHMEDEACAALKGTRPVPKLSVVPVGSIQWQPFDPTFAH